MADKLKAGSTDEQSHQRRILAIIDDYLKRTARRLANEDAKRKSCTLKNKRM
jgi:hypothetical protein